MIRTNVKSGKGCLKKTTPRQLGRFPSVDEALRDDWKGIVHMSIKAFFVDFYGTIVHEDGEVIKKITDIICKRIIWTCIELKRSVTGWSDPYRWFRQQWRTWRGKGRDQSPVAEPLRKEYSWRCGEYYPAFRGVWQDRVIISDAGCFVWYEKS